MKNLKFRAATPEDVETIIPLMYSAGPDAYDYTFKTKENCPMEFLKMSFPRHHGIFSYKHHYVAEYDGKVVGGGCILKSNHITSNTLSTLWHVFLHYGVIKGINITKKLQQASEICPAPEKNEQIIANVGIAPDYQKKGIGKQLMYYLFEQSNLSHPIMLDVATTNSVAEALYAKIGFEVISETHSSYKNNYGHIDSLRRMKLNPQALLKGSLN
ncbi:GNAT family N-acetyltransferase [Algivirga pacifica]|uniref:N-acetyltransferase domain-containing protein n=1 Tax=Algivirga pacifica TaxID=1162670 RepID=A0ABP9DI49_9BACT